MAGTTGVMVVLHCLCMLCPAVSCCVLLYTRCWAAG